MLNPIAEPNVLSSQFGFLNSSTSEALGIGQVDARTNFSAQLQALMQGRQASQGQLGLLAQAKALNVMNDAALEQLAQNFSLELDLSEGESVFDQLSTWMAEQGLATGLAFGAHKAEKKPADAEAHALQFLAAESNTESEDLALTATMLQDNLTKTENVNPVQQYVDVELAKAALTDQVAEAEGRDVNALTLQDQIMSDHSANLSQAETAQADGQIDIQQVQIVSEPHVDSLPVAEGDIQEVVVADANITEFEDLALNISNQPAIDSLSDIDNVTEAVNAVGLEPVVLETPFDNVVNQDAPVVAMAQAAVLTSAEQAEAIKLANNQSQVESDQLAMDDLVDEVAVVLNSAQSAAVQQSQASAPGLVHNPQQTLMQRQAQAQANLQTAQSSVSSAAPESDHVPAAEVIAKGSSEASGRVLTPQQQVLQNAAQQQILNLNNREIQALQQQGALKASDMKLVNMDESAGAELLVTTPQAGERKASSPFLASISYPLRHPQWSQSVGKRIVFMANQQMQQAQIRLNPEHLGPIQVKLHMARDQMVSVSMTAQHGTTREALEAAIPRLKEMLTEAGINFDSVTVNDERQFASFDSNENSRSNAGKQSGVEGDDSVEDESLQTKKSTDNMIDFYA